MLSTDQCREICPTLETVPDEEVIKICKTLYEMGQLALESWEREKVGSKNLTWFLPQAEEDIR